MVMLQVLIPMHRPPAVARSQSAATEPVAGHGSPLGSELHGEKSRLGCSICHVNAMQMGMFTHKSRIVYIYIYVHISINEEI